jgi:photosystem II stability/assembly factor-like uncharacterized protein
VIRRGLALAVLLAGCAGQPAIAPTPSTTLPPASAPPTAAPPTAIAGRTASPAPTTEPIPLPTFAELSAPSATVVWALVAARRLFRSTDRGDSWTERALPASLTNPEIAFISDSEGWMGLAGPPGTQCQQQSIQFAHTADGAATWQAVTSTGIAAAQCKENLVFPDAQHGFLSAWDPNDPPVIYRTGDGGKTWAASRPLPDPPGFTSTNAGFTLRAGAVRAFGQALLVEAVGQTTDGQRRYVFISGDGGASWRFVFDVPDPDVQVVFVTGSRWFQLSAGAVPKETTDSGSSWHAFTTDYTQAAPIAPVVVFGDEQTGYATVRGSIKRSTDGGAHWTPIHTPGT